jgi:hypothetical protein
MADVAARHPSIPRGGAVQRHERGRNLNTEYRPWRGDDLLK